MIFDIFFKIIKPILSLYHLRGNYGTCQFYTIFCFLQKVILFPETKHEPPSSSLYTLIQLRFSCDTWFHLLSCFKQIFISIWFPVFRYDVYQYEMRSTVSDVVASGQWFEFFDSFTASNYPN